MCYPAPEFTTEQELRTVSKLILEVADASSLFSNLCIFLASVALVAKSLVKFGLKSCLVPLQLGDIVCQPLDLVVFLRLLSLAGSFGLGKLCLQAGILCFLSSEIISQLFDLFLQLCNFVLCNLGPCREAWYLRIT